jgi:hypothetical protein
MFQVSVEFNLVALTDSESYQVLVLSKGTLQHTGKLLSGKVSIPNVSASSICHGYLAIYVDPKP